MRARVTAARGRLSAPLFWCAAAGIAVGAIVLRVFVMVAYFPANLSYPDEASYVTAAAGKLFSNPFRPAGYSLFLRAAHLFSANLQVTVVIQHLVGLATAVLVYLLARRIGVRRWLALIPAAAVGLSGDELYLEHVLLADGLFLSLLVCSCYCAVRAYQSQARARVVWLAAAAAVVASLATVRTVGVVLVPVLIVWVLLTGGPGWGARVRLAGVCCVVSGLVLVGYAAAQGEATGTFGLSRFSGWPLYARVAPIADCRRFTPPKGTAALCERTPTDQRFGPDFYLWDPRSPAERAFGSPPARGGALGSFALAVMEHQPGAYLGMVLRDLVRFVDPNLVTRYGWGGDWRGLIISGRLPAIEAGNVRVARTYWHTPRVRVRRRLAWDLDRWQKVFRIHGALIALCLVVSILGLLMARRSADRPFVALLTSFSLALFVASVVGSVYGARYGVPPALLLLLAATRSAEMLFGLALRPGAPAIARTARLRRYTNAPGPIRRRRSRPPRAGV